MYDLVKGTSFERRPNETQIDHVYRLRASEEYCAMARAYLEERDARYERMTIKELFRRVFAHRYPRTKMQDPKINTRYDYSQGPMYYLGQQIARQMQLAGYPCKILYCHRDAMLQDDLYAQGRTKPGKIVTYRQGWESLHNVYAATDLIHPTLAWKVDQRFWDTLAACVRIVSEKYNVPLRHGHDWDGDGIPVPQDPDEKFWDAAHVELADGKRFLERHKRQMAREDRERPMNENELWAMFEEVLPDVAKQLICDPRGSRVPNGVTKVNPELMTRKMRWRLAKQSV